MTVRVEVLTFDCYGTLVDWRRGIREAFARIASETGTVVDGDRVLDLHARIEPEVQAERYRSYREVLDRTATRIAAAIELPIPSDRARFLSSSLSEWPPFSDTVEALGKLAAAGYRLGILSNVDDALLEATLARLPIPFEFLVTAEQVGSYKPAHGHFQAARRQIGNAGWLHVAQSRFHDIEPAVELGVPAVWINRMAESGPPDRRPLAEFPDLESFARSLVDEGGLSKS